MASPHLLKDLRVLHRVLCRRQTAGFSDNASFTDLFEPVFSKATEKATRTLALLCNELAAASASQSSTKADTQLPALEPFASPIADQEGPLGVRAVSSIDAGELVCIYPGRIFLDGESRLPQGDKLLTNEYEGIHMDGKGWLPACWKADPVLAGQPQSSIWHGNRLAVGNLLNHPAEGQLPNCMPMPFWWPTWQGLGQATPAYWARLMPHVVMKDGQLIRTASGEKMSKEARQEFPPWPHMGMAFFSIRPLAAGDELLLNYRLSPPFPSWYHPVDDCKLEAEVDRQLR